MCIQLNYFLYSVVLDEVFRIDESSKKNKIEGSTSPTRTPPQ